MRHREGRSGYMLTSPEGLAARAMLYVSGKMTPADRENAERDLIDVPAFRDAVLKAAQETGRLPDPDKAGDRRDWHRITTSLARLPQLGGHLRHDTASEPLSAANLERGAADDPGQWPFLRPPWRAALVALTLFCGGLAGLALGQFLNKPPRTLSVAVLTDATGVAVATLESRSDASLRVLMTLTPGLPLALLRMEDGSITGVRIGSISFQGEAVFAGAGTGAAPADYSLVQERDDGRPSTTVADGAARAIVRD